MHSLLDFFTLNDLVPLVLLICLLHFVGWQIAGDSTAVRWWARGFAAASFLSYVGAGIATWKPTTALEFFEIGLRALLAMGTIHGVALVTVPVLLFLHEHLWAKPIERQRVSAEKRASHALNARKAREAAEWEQAERDRKAEEERRKREEIANQPPPPTREERLKAAQERYETTLRLLSSAGLDETELRAAQERAKQQYLRELDQVMQ